MSDLLYPTTPYKPPRKKVYIFNADKTLFKECKSEAEAAEVSGIREGYIYYLIRKNRGSKGFYFSYNAELKQKFEIF